MIQRSIKTNAQSTFALAIVSTVTLAILGGATTSAMQSNNGSKNNVAESSSMQENSVKESQAATDLRNGLNSLLKEHVTTNLTVNRAIVSGASDAELQIALDAQLANTASLAGAIKSIYGSEAAEEFTELFNEHIFESNRIAMAVASGNEIVLADAEEELQDYLEDITVFFTSAIKCTPYDEAYGEVVFGLLEEHESLMNQSTEALENSNFGQSKKIEQQAIRQVSIIADALASGIIDSQEL